MQKVVFYKMHLNRYHKVYIDDVIARRTRLAFLNKEAAIKAIPKVVNLMGNELKWDPEKRKQESKKCIEYLHHFGGKIPMIPDTSVKKGD